MSFILNTTHQLFERYIHTESIVIDATCGNGHDTNFLASRAKKVYSFDIQPQAIETSKIKNADFNNITHIVDGHQNIGNYVSEPLDLVVFNLGYLPKGDHNITTRFETTEAAINAAFQRLKPKKAIIIVVYHGHPGGKEEATALDHYLENVPMNSADIMIHKLVNKPNNPPYIYEIVKR